MTTVAKRKVRKYSIDYLRYGFIAYPPDERLPLCLLCEQTLCNDSMKPAKLESHYHQNTETIETETCHTIVD